MRESNQAVEVCVYELVRLRYAYVVIAVCDMRWMHVYEVCVCGNRRLFFISLFFPCSPDSTTMRKPFFRPK